MDINIKPFMIFDYASVENIKLNNEAETLRLNIINKFKSLLSDKADHINTINIEYAIDITKTAKY